MAPAKNLHKNALSSRPDAEEYNGILLVDKPSGPTSHDVVDRIRKHFRIKKVGHGGTLDPLATGLLVILIAKGTKLSQWVMGSDKTYEGTMHLGIATDTEDIQGRVTEECDASHITREAVEQAMDKRTGDILQTPPMVSAIKKNGVPLYKMARKGQSVERKPRLIHVYTFELTAYEPPRARFKLKATKGTYVRTLCADIGRELGCGAMLEALRRTEAGSFSVENALTMEDILGLDLADLKKHIIPAHEVKQREGLFPT